MNAGSVAQSCSTFLIPWTVAYQVLLSVRFSRQESGLEWLAISSTSRSSWHRNWVSQFLGRFIRSLGSPRRRKESGALKKEKGVWSFQGVAKDNFFFFFLFLSPELMNAQQNNSSHSKICFSLKLHMDTLSLTKEARIYNGLKTISLTSGAGKSGQPLVKEWN